jgi:asparagine synthase (glutamine-hydrolysing)
VCGIGGILTRRTQDFPRAALAEMSGVLQHRGPDDYGVLLWDGQGAPRRSRDLVASEGARLGLVHRRLSIIDLTATGWQPMQSQDERFDIIFNGEIYNYLELRKELEAAGVRFRSTSDTEVLLAAWAVWGAGAIDRLVGMYAFVVVDWRERRMTLVRDCFGIKPLYYVSWPEGFAFASEVKALLPLASRQVAPGPLYQYLTYGLTDTGAETLFADVRQLPPATVMEVDLDDAKPAGERRYWQVPAAVNNEISFDEAAQKLGSLLVDNVRLHLRSDVPVGACLSGGIDSSAIVMMMRAAGGEKVDLHTFTYAADGSALNEERWADLVGAEAAATMHKIRVQPGELVRDLDRLIGDQDLPFSSTSIYAQHRVFAAARNAGIKVMLDGQGADEMLAGYSFYSSARAASLMREGSPAAAMSLLMHSAGDASGGSMRALLRAAAGLVPPGVMASAAGLLRRFGKDRSVNHAWFGARNALDDRSFWEHRHSLRSSLASTFAQTNLPALLRYEDRNSMAHSIESRVPFLTRSLAEFVFSLPERFLIAADGTSKSVLRAALRGIVPDAVLDRRDKIGFQTPESNWLGELAGWVSSVLGSETARAIPALRADAMQRQWSAVQQGRMSFHPRIWRWLNLIRWAEQTGARFS